MFHPLRTYAIGRAAPRRWAALVLFALAFVLSGCATQRSQLSDTLSDTLTDNNSPDDPFEPVNRVVYKFNDALDKAVLQPVARGYVDVVPLPVRNCVRNIFNNLDDIPGALNNALQGRLGSAASNTGRLAVNSTAGILGCFDVASEMGIDKRRGDFGETLGVWGVPPGPYLMLPLLGPSTVRDAAAKFTVDIKTNAIAYIDDIPLRNQTYVLSVVDDRASLLNARSMLENAALDPYVFLREAYLGRRRSRVNGSNGRDPKGDYASVPDEPAITMESTVEAAPIVVFSPRVLGPVDTPKQAVAPAATSEPARLQPVAAPIVPGTDESEGAQKEATNAAL